MSVPLRIEIMQRETIKPSSPTPLHLRSLKLSLLDQFMPVVHIPLLLFYPRNGNDTDHLAKATERSLLLKTSLSEALTHFYPFAGRLKDNSSIECDDHGAEYIEARIHCILSDILKKPDTEVLKQLLPAALSEAATARDSQLLVQASFFDCGGLAIGVNLSHKVADAATVTSFIKCWAATARRSSTEVVISPVFMGASIFPQMDLPIPMLPVDLIQGESVMKRFVFEAPKITALKAKAISASVPDPTRVESVTALIWKCAMSASRSNLGVPRKSVLSLGVNIRKRLVPTLPDNYGGNYVGSISARMEDHDDLELQGIVSRIRKDLIEFGENYAKITQGDDTSLAICKAVEEFGKMATSKDIDYYNGTSWCRFELYDADFGWGKPTWLSTVFTIELKNLMCLIDTRDGDGIEACISLSPEDMALFESNRELLEFAAANHSSHRVNERLPYYCAIVLGFQLRRLHTVHLRRISHYRAIALGFQLRRLHNVHLVRKPNITHHRFIGILIVLGLVDKCSGLNPRGVLEIECPFFKGENSRASPWKRIPLCCVPQAQGLLEMLDKDRMGFYVWTTNGSSLSALYRDEA
eukprot:XP_024466442.1 BAHD acyltransferase At5g47980 [Populus trichocarpa]